MPLHDFTPHMAGQPRGVDVFNPSAKKAEPTPHVLPYPPGVRQDGDVLGGRTDITGPRPPEYIEDFLVNGFYYLDEAMQAYWSGIKVPTKDAYRGLRIKIAGGDKSLKIWRDDVVNGRVVLPVAAIDRTSHEFNVQKFSPPYLAMGRKYTSRRGDMVSKVYRPVPFLVDYTMTVWAEHKTDAEVIAYQVATRFNRMAEFSMNDQHIVGNVQLQFGGFNDASDKEVASDEQQTIRYEFKMVAEAWLPLPEKIVPSILGHVSVVKEQVTNTIYWAQRGNGPGFVPIVE